MRTAIRLAAATWMLASSIAFCAGGGVLCLYGPLGATLGVPCVALGMWMGWEAGSLAAGE